MERSHSGLVRRPGRLKRRLAVLGEKAYTMNMFYVYVLQSLKDGNLYIGKTKDLRKRLKKHLNAEVPSTKYRLPLKLVYYEAYTNKKQ